MCGIWGWWERRGAPAPDHRAIEAATAPMTARGPDDFGMYRSDVGLALGFRRLSIIDLETGHQPVANEDGSVQVVLNGEIYNYRELRDQLAARGHRFATRSDTEVIAHGYEEWGDDVCEHLCGMFAFAVWDAAQRRLLLVRDRLGIKPLYFAQTADAFGFASDPRTLTGMPGVDTSTDVDALALYLYFGNVPAPRSIHRGVRKLRPGQRLVVTRDAERAETWWELDFEPLREAPGALRERFRELFGRVVEQHLVADVPLGAFLSGGMDSTAVAMAAGDARSEPLLTFNVAFDDAAADESAWARQAAATLGTDHREQRLDNDPADHIVEALSAFPEPFADSAAVPGYLLSGRIRKLCTVALAGDGGDEVFGGYSMRTAQALAALRRLPRGLRAAGRALPMLGAWCDLSLRDVASVYAASREKLPIAQIERVLGPDARPAQALEAHLEVMRDELSRVRWRDALSPTLYLDQRFGLPDQMLTKVDVTSMAHSLEVRVPFLDHRIVELAAGLPPELKQKGFGARRTKRVIRWYLERRFPPEFVHRPKQGFGLPIVGALAARLREQTAVANGRLRLDLPDALDSRALAGLVGAGELGDAARWALWALSIWHRA